MTKNSKRLGTIILAGAIVLSTIGCGKKDDKIVVDYGGSDSATSSSETGTSGDSTGISDTLTTSKTLVEQLGDYAKWTEPFTAQEVSFETNKLYKVPDADHVNSYAVQVPSLSSEDEQAFADRFFDDGATKLEELKYTNESQYMIQMYKYKKLLYQFEINHYDYEANGEGGIERDFSCINADSDVDYKWLDNDDYSIHMYEGEYNGIDFGLIIGYDYSLKERYIFFEPTDIRQYFPDENYKTLMLEASVNNSLERVDGDNKCSKSDEEVLEAAQMFASDTVGLSELDSQMGFNSYMYDNTLADISLYMYGGFTRPECISVMSFSDGEYFSTMDESLSELGARSIDRLAEQTDYITQYDEEKQTGKSWDTFYNVYSSESYREEVNVVRDGYAVYLNSPFHIDSSDGTYVDMPTFITDISTTNIGCVMFTSKGLFGADLKIGCEIREVVEDVALADYKTVKDNCIAAIEENMELAYIGAPKSFSLVTAELTYEITEPDENNMAEVVPAWVFVFLSDEAEVMVTMDATDASLISLIQFRTNY